jgi:hypothetical protein
MKKKTITIQQHFIILTIIIPNLGLHDINDGDLESFTEDKIEKIDAEAAFAAVTPSTLTVDAKKVEYSKALAKVQDGTTSDTKDKIKKRKELEELITLQASDCARIAGNDTVLFSRSGYKAKDVKGTPVGELDAPENIVFRNYGKNQGELQPDWNGVEHADNYTVQVYTDPLNPDTSVIKELTVKKSIAVIGGLTRKIDVWVRVRANGGSTGKGPWSDPATKLVP